MGFFMNRWEATVLLDLRHDRDDDETNERRAPPPSHAQSEPRC